MYVCMYVLIIYVSIFHLVLRMCCMQLPHDKLLNK